MTATCPDCGCPPEKPGRVANPYRPRGPHGMWKDCKHPFHSTPDPVGEGASIPWIPYTNEKREGITACVETGEQAKEGRCPIHGGDACLHSFVHYTAPVIYGSEAVKLEAERDRAIKTILGVEDALRDAGQAITSPLSDATVELAAERDRLREALETAETMAMRLAARLPVVFGKGQGPSEIRQAADLQAFLRSAPNTGTDDG